jgi:hypothetical protein
VSRPSVIVSADGINGLSDTFIAIDRENGAPRYVVGGVEVTREIYLDAVATLQCGASVRLADLIDVRLLRGELS